MFFEVGIIGSGPLAIFLRARSCESGHVVYGAAHPEPISASLSRCDLVIDARLSPAVWPSAERPMSSGAVFVGVATTEPGVAPRISLLRPHQSVIVHARDPSALEITCLPESSPGVVLTAERFFHAWLKYPPRQKAG